MKKFLFGLGVFGICANANTMDKLLVHQSKELAIAHNAIALQLDDADVSPDMVCVFCDIQKIAYDFRGAVKHVTFGLRSKLKCICKDVFAYAGLETISIPDSVEELCGGCFAHCRSLKHVTFGPSSKLKRICKDAFAYAGLETMSIPDSVEELCDGCFAHCGSLKRVTFGLSSKLKRICKDAFAYAGVESIVVPDSVIELCCGCFLACSGLKSITFGMASQLECMGGEVFAMVLEYASIASITIPDSVLELGDSCFYGCYDLRSITFGAASQLERVGRQAFIGTSIAAINIPAGVMELCSKCFYGCESLRDVVFCSGSKLARIGKEAFAMTSLEFISIPDSVVELCFGCFHRCEFLKQVVLGKYCSLENIGVNAFDRHVDIYAPSALQDIIEHSDFVKYNNLKRSIVKLLGVPIDLAYVTDNVESLRSSIVRCRTFRDAQVVLLIIPADVINISMLYWQLFVNLRYVVFEKSSQLQTIRVPNDCLIKQIFTLDCPNLSKDVLSKLPVQPCVLKLE